MKMDFIHLEIFQKVRYEMVVSMIGYKMDKVNVNLIRRRSFENEFSFNS